MNVFFTERLPVGLETLVDALNHEALFPKVFGARWPNEELATGELERIVLENYRVTICEVFSQKIRFCAESWIESGIDAEGIERPGQRYVQTDVNELLSEWTKHNRVSILITSNGRRFVDADMDLPSEMLSEYVDRFHPTMAIPLGLGYKEITDRRKGLDFSPEYVGNDTACRYFLTLLEHPDKSRVALCGNPACNRFFLHKRKPRSEIRHRSCCNGCQHFASMSRTNAVRKGRRDRLVHDAASLLFADDSETQRSSKWIAERLNKGTRLDLRISANTVTKNRRVIDAKLAEMQAAKLVETSKLDSEPQ